MNRNRYYLEPKYSGDLTFGCFVNKAKGMKSLARIFGNWNRRFIFIDQNNMSCAYADTPLSKGRKYIMFEEIVSIRRDVTKTASGLCLDIMCARRLFTFEAENELGLKKLLKIFNSVIDCTTGERLYQMSSGDNSFDNSNKIGNACITDHQPKRKNSNINSPKKLSNTSNKYTKESEINDGQLPIFKETAEFNNRDDHELNNSEYLDNIKFDKNIKPLQRNKSIITDVKLSPITSGNMNKNFNFQELNSDEDSNGNINNNNTRKMNKFIQDNDTESNIQ